MRSRVSTLMLLLAWLCATAAGAFVGVQSAWERENSAFEADSRAALRWLNQQIREQERLLDTLAVLQPAAVDGVGSSGQARLPALHPAVQRVLRRDARQDWPAPQAERLAAAEVLSSRGDRAALAQLDLAAGRLVIVRAAEPASFALQLDLRQLTTDDEALALGSHGELRAWLEHSGQRRVIAPGAPGIDEGGLWRLTQRQRLTSELLPAELVTARRIGWAALPWSSMALWGLVAGLGLASLAARRRQPASAGLGNFGETEFEFSNSDFGLAAEPRRAAPNAERAVQALQQQTPLFVTLREIDKEPPELAVARGAIREAARHARQASQLISRLSRGAGPESERGEGVQGVRLDELLRDALELVEPECARLGVVTTLATDEDIGWVLADSIALEQVVHQMIAHALHAVAEAPAGERRIELTLASLERQLILTVRDSGPAPAQERLSRLFDPAPSRGEPTGLARCRTLVDLMRGSLAVSVASPRGSVLRLSLPRHL
jgi:signal transduction histidine kinase